MRTRFLRTALVLFAAAVVAAHAPNWREYKNAGGNFSILMPSEPSDTTNEEPAGDSHTFQSTDNSGSYNITYVKFRDEQKLDETNFNSRRSGFIKHFPNCKVSIEQAAAPAIRDYIGGFFRLDCDLHNTKASYVGNLYLGKHYFYAVLAIFISGPSDPPSGKKFVDSFALIDPNG